MRVRITKAAVAELEDIGNFIAEDNPLRAASFVSELVERCNGLAQNAHRYQVVTVVAGREVRKCSHGSYLIFYSIIGEEVEVNHVIHGSRDYARLLYPDD